MKCIKGNDLKNAVESGKYFIGCKDWKNCKYTFNVEQIEVRSVCDDSIFNQLVSMGCKTSDYEIEITIDNIFQCNKWTNIIK